MLRTLQLLIILSLFLTGESWAQGALAVRPDRQNVVAGRIAGDWELDSLLTTRLGGSLSASAEGVDFRAGQKASFRSDSTVAQRLPKWLMDAVTKDMPSFQIFMAGKATLGGTEYPFLLTSLNGNMQVLFMRPRGNDPLGDGESFIVQLAIAREPSNDVLLIGGDFNNQPFVAMRRVGSAPIGGGRGGPPIP